MFIVFSSHADKLTIQGQVTPLNVYSEGPQRLTMRCSEPAPLSRHLLSHPAAFAHHAAQVPRQLRRSLSLGSLAAASTRPE
jgi:hypothetical protein